MSLLLVVFVSHAGTIYQAGTFVGYMQGVKGSTSLAQLLKHGNFGLGEENAMSGVDLIYNGKVYVSDINGKTKTVPLSSKVPWMMVIDFKPTLHFTLHNIHSMQQLQAAITRHLPSENLFYAIRIHSDFSHLTTRTLQPKKSNETVMHWLT